MSENLVMEWTRRVVDIENALRSVIFAFDRLVDVERDEKTREKLISLQTDMSKIYDKYIDLMEEMMESMYK